MNKQNSQNLTCYICGKNFKSVTGSHTKTHGLSLNDYKILFGEDTDSYRQCNYHNEDTKHKCKLNAYPGSNENLCILHHRSKDKDQVLFDQVLESLIKTCMIFKSELHLEGTYFPGAFSLSNKTIENNAYFVGCHFLGKVDCSGSTFMNYAGFNNCTFEEDSTFQDSKFLGETHFRKSVFRKKATFRWANFHKNVSFWLTEFMGDTSFWGTEFGQQVRFVSSTFPKSLYYINFVGASFEKPHLVFFSSVDFSRVLFRWCDLSKIGFQNVKWPVTPKLKGARHYLLDEFYPWRDRIGSEKHSAKQHYDFVQDLYQQLKRNYEEQRSYAEAGDFYYGEMECYRKSFLSRRYLPSLVNLYRISSGYGQRYIRAGIVLILMLLFFTGSHMFLGLTPTQHNSNYSKIQYSLDLNFGELNIDFNQVKSFILDLFISTTYCIEVLIREEEPDRLFKPISIWGDVLNSTFSILVYLQVLFFVLAVRRHFKR